MQRTTKKSIFRGKKGQYGSQEASARLRNAIQRARVRSLADSVTWHKLNQRGVLCFKEGPAGILPVDPSLDLKRRNRNETKRNETNYRFETRIMIEGL